MSQKNQTNMFLSLSYKEAVSLLWEENDEIYKILKNAKNTEDARITFYQYINKLEYTLLAEKGTYQRLEVVAMTESLRVCKNIFAPISEEKTKTSAISNLYKIAQGKSLDGTVSVAFLVEFIALFRGVAGNSGIYKMDAAFEAKQAEFKKLEGREAATVRTDALDILDDSMQTYFDKYPSGLREDIKAVREENEKKILSYFKGVESDWDDAQWHMRNVIKDAETLFDLVSISDAEKEGVRQLAENRIPFGITPYYLSLMDLDAPSSYDTCVRAMVIPPPNYVETMVSNTDVRGSKFDFMGEADTSPVDLVTRRYPKISILKPFNTCAQICVYCQRNWEIDEVLDPKAMSPQNKIDDAIKWISEHDSVGDVLITGGDPLVMNDLSLKKIVEKVAAIPHVYRIRIGSRTPVVMPMRFTDKLMDMLDEFYVPGKREISIVTHFEHSYEITPEALEAIQKIRRKGMSVYNQEVFTIDNSRRFETCKLRRDLKTIGVDPYYTFNMKGKQETRRYMVPMARLLQERKEEARLLPGLDRTDEPVFNVPRLGKNHLRAGQDHTLIMILDDGSRIYEMHPWEKFITSVETYNYRDLPILEYLQSLDKLGENLNDYKTIWYYY